MQNRDLFVFVRIPIQYPVKQRNSITNSRLSVGLGANRSCGITCAKMNCQRIYMDSKLACGVDADTKATNSGTTCGTVPEKKGADNPKPKVP